MEIRDTMLPVLGPKGGEEEINALHEVIESGWWGKGPKVAEFEKTFAEMVGAKYAVAVTPGYYFGEEWKYFIRISLAQKTVIFKKAIDYLDMYLKEI